MRRWALFALALSVAGCGTGPISAPKIDTGPLTTLSNGVIGVQIGRDGLPMGDMYITAKQIGAGPDPLERVPFPQRFSLTTVTYTGDDGPQPFHPKIVSSHWQTSTNTLFLVAQEGETQIEIGYSLSRTEPALTVTLDVRRGPGIQLLCKRVESPMVGYGYASRAEQGSESGDPLATYLLGAGSGYSCDVTLGDVDMPHMPNRLRAPRVQIDGDDESTQALNAMIWRLTSSYSAGQCWGPFSLTSDKYGGRAFWDLDAWIQPAMVFLDPDTAKKAAEWRLSTLPQARANYDAWVKAGRPVSDKENLADVSGPEGPEMPTPAPGGAMFAWESAMDGKELSTAPTRFEHHVTGSVCLGLRYAELAGLVPPAQVRDVYRAALRFYEARASKDGPTGRSLKHVVSPDEWHTVDNDLYINSLANWLGSMVPGDDPYRFPLPRDATTYLAYDGDETRAYQQASALLAVWPLAAVTDPEEIGKMYDRFAGKEAPQGPAMTKSLNALVAARIGRTDDAYKEWQDSWKLYTDDPLLRFREKQKQGDGYFFTGAAGCVNTFLYGFLGLGFDPVNPPERDSSGELRGSRLRVSPRLPGKWKHVVVDGLYVFGKRIRLDIKDGTYTVSDAD